MKKWKLYTAAGILLAMPAGMSGCEHMVEAAVVAEMQKETAGEGGRTVFEQKAALGQTDTEALFGSAEKADGQSGVQNQVSAPERYTADVSFDQVFTSQQDEGAETPGTEISQTVHITADAPVEVPQVDEIHLKKVNAAAFSEERMKQWAELLSEGNPCTETEEKEEDKNCKIVHVTVDDIPYFGTYPASAEDAVGYPFFSWAIDQSACDLRRVLAGESETDAEDYEKMSAELLERLGISGFELFKVSELEDYANWTGEETEEEITAFILRYERVADGVWALGTTAVEYPEYREDRTNVWAPDYLELTWAGGHLVSLTCMVPMEISDYSDESLFLLPFEEIRQIFENTIGEKMTGQGAEVPRFLSEFEDLFAVALQYPEVAFQNLEISISEVRLSYMRIREEEELTPGAEEGILIPVWDFYGTWTGTDTDENGTVVGEKMESEDVSLLTIDARDGTILQRMVGY